MKGFSLLALLIGQSISEEAPLSSSTLCEVYDLPSEATDDAYFYFHGDQVCDRSQYNAMKDRMGRAHTYNRFRANNEFNRVPNAKTVVCPLQVEDMMPIEATFGFDTIWIVENTSSEPIVLSFVGQDGVEYSAINARISPPQSDPQAVLQPKQWRSIFAWEGHVFHARSFDEETGTLGPVLLQHRAGLIPVGANAQNLECPLEDPEPLIKTGRKPELDPAFDRRPPVVDRRCNTIDIGFRNMANCPLHAYHIEKDPNRLSCREQYKYHLGVNDSPTDFFWQWDSRTKFEQTYVGHTFAFRLAANPSVLVDTVTLQPTRITDCPELKKKTQINKVTKVAEVEQVFLPVTNQGDEVSKHEQLLDSITRMERHGMAGFFNMTHSVNGTIMHGRKFSLRDSAGKSHAGIISL